MRWLLLLVLLALIFAGIGFVVHVLWWVAVITAVLVLVGFVSRGGAAGSR
jgi:hypothetical protein